MKLDSIYISFKLLWIGYRGLYDTFYSNTLKFLDIIDFVRYLEYFYFVTTLESKVQYFFWKCNILMDKHFSVYYRRPLCSEISVSMILIHIARNVSMLVRAFTLMPLIVSRAWFCSQSCKTVCLCHNVVVTRFLWNLVLNQIMVRIMGGVVVEENIYQILSYQYFMIIW